MSSELFLICSMALTHGAAIGFAVRELILLRRYRAGDSGRDRPTPLVTTPGPRGDEPGMKPLPACLIPTLRMPARVLEDA